MNLLDTITTTTPTFRWSAVDQAVATVDDLAPDQIEQLKQLPELKIITNALTTGEASLEGSLIKTLHCTASSTIEDLHGDTMTLSCVQDMATQARKNLTIFLNHKYSAPEDVGGRVYAASAANSTEKDADGLDIYDLHYDIALTRNNPRVDQLYAQIKEDGIRLGVSIGAYILEYDFKNKEEGFWGGLIINKVLLVETSIVGIPANQRSWVQNGVIAIGKHLGFAEKQIRRVLDGKEAAPLMKTASLTVSGTTTNDNTLPVVLTATTPVVDEAAPETPIETASAEPDEDEAQEEAEAAPVTESTAEQTETTTEESAGETTVEATALAEAAPEIALSLDAGGTPEVELVLAALEHAAEALRAVRAEKAALESEISVLKDERDQAFKDRDDAAEIIVRVAKSPLGRKTQFREPVESFQARFAGIYDAGFLKLISETE